MKTLGFLTCCAVLTMTGCSFTTAGGLTECETSSDCSSNQVCTQGYCLPQPEGCGEVYGPTASNPIVLGAALPLSTSAGQDASEEQALNAIKMALSEINDRQGVGGRLFNLLICDTASNPDRARTQAAWLVNDKKVPAIFSSGSGQTVAISSETIKAKVLLISHTATSPDIANLSDKLPDDPTVGTVWRTAPSDTLQGRIIGDLVRNARPLADTSRPYATATSVGIAYVDDVYGQGLFDQLLTRIGTDRTVTSAKYPRNGDISSARDLFVPQTGAPPSVGVLAGFSEDNARLIEQVASRGNTTQKWFFTDASKDPTLITTLKTNSPLVEGAYGTAPAQARPGDPVYNTFNQRFRSTYNNTDPGQYSFTAHAYDAMYLVALGAAYAAGPDANAPRTIDGAGIAKGLAHVTPPEGEAATIFALGIAGFSQARGEISAGKYINVRGASGELDFDANGEAPSEYELFRIEGGAFKTVELITPTED
ncbi:ABC transporter substrate-binding protein [Myxococcus sp. K15C18031901]|uniref:ABC transporter substrate-binding protein n=1 Tax=Myxococcus dinghuensis TaxID=2906761 RepID=UPI0020A766D2|nr:ABC transporter substrate-binding protein [Myxococcus dinghuensis]MCP3103578.1 ABC transporter substrate-binding protein [Myxococcus dinghuensis]